MYQIFAVKLVNGVPKVRVIYYEDDFSEAQRRLESYRRRYPNDVFAMAKKGELLVVEVDGTTICDVVAC